MEPRADNGSPLAGTPRRVAQRLLAYCENRLELFQVEVQEERERVLHALGLAAGLLVFVLLAGFALTLLIAAAAWELSPVLALGIVTAIYAAIAGVFLAALLRMRRGWTTLPATKDQLKKDHECLKKHLN